ncbi:zinc finger protein 8-like [Sphaeramia orbicularis]|uniref:zinc finger protein 8-like n=1 Tax=Sphaeramia orbicularis TaxID=375764 RepID=UPI0011812E90|nr:zinc finger protein 8-like [Sphaeramia orbicularis]
MCTNMPTGSLNLESQLLSIMDVLVKAAVAEISQLFSESSSSLRLHLTQSLKENESLRMRVKVMRSELFSLKLQTRTNRPASRFLPTRSNTPKPRNRTQAIKPSTDQPASVTINTENKTSSPVAEKCSNAASPDVILIKDEDDADGCSSVGGQSDFGNHSAQDGVAKAIESVGVSCLTDGDGLRIVSVHGRGQGPLKDNESLFTATELQAFGSLSPDPSVTHDSLLNFTPGSNETLSGMQTDGTGTMTNNQVERNHSTQTASPLTNKLRADGAGGHSSPVKQLSSVFSGPTKPLYCNFCHEHFSSRDDLIAHRAAHTGESPVTCSMCSKIFVNKHTLSIHMRIHTGEKPYVCPQCGKRFTQNGGLKIHLRTHSGEKPYTCSACPASFNNPSNLRRHMITHNNF